MVASGSFLFPAESACPADDGNDDGFDFLDIYQDEPQAVMRPAEQNTQSFLPLAISTCNNNNSGGSDFSETALVELEQQHDDDEKRRKENTDDFLTRALSRHKDEEQHPPSVVRRVNSELSLGSRKAGTRRGRRKQRRNDGGDDNGGGGAAGSGMRQSASCVSFEVHSFVIADEISQLVDQELEDQEQGGGDAERAIQDRALINCEIIPNSSPRMGRCESELSLDSLLDEEEEGGNKSAVEGVMGGLPPSTRNPNSMTGGLSRSPRRMTRNCTSMVSLASIVECEEERAASRIDGRNAGRATRQDHQAGRGGRMSRIRSDLDFQSRRPRRSSRARPSFMSPATCSPRDGNAIATNDDDSEGAPCF